MIAANGSPRPTSNRRDFLPSVGFCDLRNAGTASRSSRLVSVTGSPTRPDAVALEAFSPGDEKAAPGEVLRPLPAVVKLIGRGEYALDPPGGETARTLRAGGEGLHPLPRRRTGASPILSRNGS